MSSCRPTQPSCWWCPLLCQTSPPFWGKQLSLCHQTWVRVSLPLCWVGGSSAPFPFHQSVSPPWPIHQAFMLLFGPHLNLFLLFVLSHKAVAIPVPTWAARHASLAFPSPSRFPMEIFPSPRNSSRMSLIDQRFLFYKFNLYHLTHKPILCVSVLDTHLICEHVRWCKRWSSKLVQRAAI